MYVNQFSSSTNVVAQLLKPLRPLLSTKSDFLWSPNHQQAFNAIKDTLTSAPVLSYFDISKPTHLSIKLMLVAMALASYYNKTQQAHGTSSKQDHNFSLIPNPDMQLLN